MNKWKNGKKNKIIYFIINYQPNENNNEKVKILDKVFIEKNKNKSKILYKNKLYELKEYFEDIDRNYNHKDSIKFKLIFVHNIIDLSYAFYNCDSLISLSDNNEINQNISYLQFFIINASYMFYNCKSLISIPDISNWNTSKVNNMSYMLFGCNSLISLPDISTLDLSNINNMKNMFQRNKSSLKLEDFYILNKYIYKNSIILEISYINKKNKKKIRILGKKFIEKNKDKGRIIYNNREFKLTEYFEDIDNNYKNENKIILCLDKDIDDLSYIFYKCESLISIEYYNINDSAHEKEEVNDYNSIFSYSNEINCGINNNNTLLKNYNERLPNYSSISSNNNNSNYEIEKEDFQIYFPISFFRPSDMSYMFYDCESLISLPDISIWDTSNVNNMSGIFMNCKSLISLPDISKWNTYCVNDISEIFLGCDLLIYLPDISKWNTYNIKNMSRIFSGCHSLMVLPDVSKWDISNVNNLEYAFAHCNSLISLPNI